MHDIYIDLWDYYEHNLSMYSNFVEVNNKIMDLWNLHGEYLSNGVKMLEEAKANFSEEYSEYELDLSDPIRKKLNKYIQLIQFTYQSDGIGLYENYYEKLFEMLDKNHKKMNKIMKEINSLIKAEYKEI